MSQMTDISFADCSGRSDEQDCDLMDVKITTKPLKASRISETRKLRRNISPYKHQSNGEHEKILEKFNIPRLNLKFAKQIQRIINEEKEYEIENQINLVTQFSQLGCDSTRSLPTSNGINTRRLPTYRQAIFPLEYLEESELDEDVEEKNK